MNENDEKTTKNLLNKRKGRDGKPWFPAIKGRGIRGNLGFPTYMD